MSRIKYRNFETHQTQRNYTVFYFHSKDPADFFEALLIEQNIPYERGEGKDLIRRHLFGVHHSYLEQAEKLNDQTGEFFRKPFLGDRGFRNFVLIFTLLVVILALIGYFIAA